MEVHEGVPKVVNDTSKKTRPELNVKDIKRGGKIAAISAGAFGLSLLPMHILNTKDVRRAQDALKETFLMSFPEKKASEYSAEEYTKFIATVENIQNGPSPYELQVREGLRKKFGTEVSDEISQATSKVKNFNKLMLGWIFVPIAAFGSFAIGALTVGWSIWEYVRGHVQAVISKVVKASNKFFER